jgi:hypothetical protein
MTLYAYMQLLFVEEKSPMLLLADHKEADIYVMMTS